MKVKYNVGKKYANELSSIFHLQKIMKGVR